MGYQVVRARRDPRTEVLIIKGLGLGANWHNLTEKDMVQRLGYRVCGLGLELKAFSYTILRLHRSYWLPADAECLGFRFGLAWREVSGA